MMNHSTKLVYSTIAICLSLFFAVSTRALTINATFDSSVTSLPNASQVEAAVASATHTLQILYTNPITVNITVYWGDVGPFTNGIDLGASQTLLIGSTGFAYPQLTNALRNARTTAAASNSVASLPATDPTGGKEPWWLPRAEAKALKLTSIISPTDTNVDGSVGFASGESYTFDATNRAVAGEYDFIAVAEHEITEVFGRSFILNYLTSGYEPYDLFRFTNSGDRSFGVYDTNVYFSVNNGVTNLKDFYGDVNSGDIQDWQMYTPADSFDAFLTDGEKATLSSADLTAVNILGYSLNFTMSRPTATRLNSTTFELSFTNAPGLDFTILASTNLTSSVTNWTDLGAPIENPAGQYQFIDSTANTVRFYRLRLN